MIIPRVSNLKSDIMNSKSKTPANFDNAKYNVPKHMYEFQMLYGVTPKLRESIVNEGHTMRVYVPFGKQWYGYSTRRLKENPQMVSHIIKAIFYKG